MPTTDSDTRPGERALAAGGAATSAVLALYMAATGSPVTGFIGLMAAVLLYRHARQQ